MFMLTFTFTLHSIALHTFAYVQIYIYTLKLIHTQTCIHTHRHLLHSLHTYIHACMHACMHACINTFKYVKFAAQKYAYVGM